MIKNVDDNVRAMVLVCGEPNVDEVAARSEIHLGHLGAHLAGRGLALRDSDGLFDALRRGRTGERQGANPGGGGNSRGSQNTSAAVSCFMPHVGLLSRDCPNYGFDATEVKSRVASGVSLCSRRGRSCVRLVEPQQQSCHRAEWYRPELTFKQLDNTVDGLGECAPTICAAPAALAQRPDRDGLGLFDDDEVPILAPNSDGT
jgi:hypothetical protein